MGQGYSDNKDSKGICIRGPCWKYRPPCYFPDRTALSFQVVNLFHLAHLQENSAMMPPPRVGQFQLAPVVDALRFGQQLTDQRKCQSHEGLDIEPTRTDPTSRAQHRLGTPATDGPGR